MRIISDFKDYYDSALAYGRDDELVFIRKQERRVLMDDAWPGNREALRLLRFGKPWIFSYWNAVKPVLLLFCSRAYPYWLHRKQDGDLDNPEAVEHLMTLEQLITEIEADKKGERYWAAKDDIPHFVRAHREALGKEVGLEIFHEVSAPYLLLAPFRDSGGAKRVEILTNPKLK